MKNSFPFNFFSHFYLTSLISELPWNEPTIGCKEYLAWKENKYTMITPWSKLDTLSLSFIRKILVPNPEKRLTMDKLKIHKWCQMPLTTTGNILTFSFSFHFLSLSFFSVVLNLSSTSCVVRKKKLNLYEAKKSS
jgi:serine/threonine protein kinase